MQANWVGLDVYKFAAIYFQLKLSFFLSLWFAVVLASSAAVCIQC